MIELMSFRPKVFHAKFSTKFYNRVSKLLNSL